MQRYPRRPWFRVIAVALGLGVAGGLVAPPAPAAAAEEEDTAFDAEQYAWQVGRLHRLFGGLYNTSYRTETFALLSELKRLSAAEMADRLAITVDVARRDGADGLEPLILALADGIQYRADSTAIQKAKSLVFGLRPWYVHKTPSDDMFEPIGRASTRVVLSVRPSAARALLGSLVLNPTALRTETLMNLSATQQRVCAMPKVRSDAHLLKSLADLDQERQVDCAEGVIGKGGRNAPTVARRVTVDACLDVPLDSLRDDSTDHYGLGDRQADLEQCLRDIDAHFRPDNVNAYADGESTLAKGLAGLLPQIELNLGAIAAEQIKQIAESARTLGGMVNEYPKAYWDYKLKEWAEEQKRQGRLGDQEIDTWAALAGAVVERGSAEGAVEDAEAGLARAQRAYDDADDAVAAALNDQSGCFACSEDEKAALERATQEAKDNREKKEQELKDAKARRDAAQARLDAATKAAAEAMARLAAIQQQKQKDDVRENDFNSAACNRLIGNGRDFTDPVDMTRLPEDWTDMTTWLDLVSYPNPDDPGETGAAATFGLPSCGADLPTSHGASNCTALTQCSDPTVQCSCNLDAETLEQQAIEFAQRRSQFVCFSTTCADGSTPRPVGQTCTCDDGSNDGSQPRPRPLPIEDVFVTTGETPLTSTTGSAGRRPLANIARDAFLNR